MTRQGKTLPVQEALDRVEELVDSLPAQGDLRAGARASFDAIRQSIAAVFGKSALGIVRSDLAGTIVEANPSFSRMLGYAPSELAGVSAMSLTHPADIEREREMVRDAMAGARDLWRMRKRYLHKSGRVVWGSLSLCVVRDDSGGGAGLIALVEDVTDGVLAEEGLKRRDGVLQAVAFAAGRFLQSPGWERSIAAVLERLGVSEGVGRAYLFKNCPAPGGGAVLRHSWRAQSVSCASPLGPGPGLAIDYSTSFERWRALMAGGELVLGHTCQFPEPERKMLAPGGAKSLVVVPIFASGSWWGFMGLDECEAEREWHSAEIDALKTAAGILGAAIGRQASEAAMRRMATAVEQAAEAIVITGRDGAVEYVNPAFEQISGYSEEETLGRNLSFLKSGRHDAGFYGEMWKTIESGRVWEGRIINRRKDGSLYEDDTTISPIRGEDGEITHFVAVKRDVTREVEMEQQLRRAQKMEAVGLLSGGVAHDFGNILTPIMAYADIVASGMEKTNPLLGYVNEIQKAAGRAEMLIRQLMSFSRKKEIDLKAVNLNDVAKGVGKMLGRVMREDIEISFRLSDDIGPVRADVSQVEQILMNLAVNARDAMSSGGTLSIATESRELSADVAMESGVVPAGRYTVLSVADTGCGMDDTTRSQIFEPFFTTKAGGEGTGLGLSTVYGIVKQHGAGIEVESEVGRGTTFRIYFPEMRGAREDEAPARQPEEEDLHGTETVLVVEDDSNVRTLASEALKRFGYTVIDFEDPTRALSFMKRTSQPVQLLLTDIIMPRMNGRELCVRLQSLAPGLKVLYMSGYAGSTISKYGVFDGEVRFLRKPFTLQALAREVRHALDG